MAYKAMMNDGSTITIDTAVSSKKDGSGTYFYDADGKQVANFADGLCKGSYPADATVTAAPSATAPA